jgi:hypothetical protein
MEEEETFSKRTGLNMLFIPIRVAGKQSKLASMPVYIIMALHTGIYSVIDSIICINLERSLYHKTKIFRIAQTPGKSDKLPYSTQFQ